MERERNDIEAMLKGMPLAAPSSELDARVAVTLAKAKRQASSLRPHADADEAPAVIRRVWFAVAAAAVIAAAIMIGAAALLSRPSVTTDQPIASGNVPASKSPSATDASDTLQPMLASSESSYTYAGVMQGSDGQPVRVLQRRTVEKWTWIDPETNARVEAEVPKDEVVLMSLAMY